MDQENENDLPLVSNVSDILVSHYMFKFVCNFEKKQFQCCVVLFLKSVTKNDEQSVCNCLDSSKNKLNSGLSPFSLDTKVNFQNQFKVILDCHKICIDDVEELSVDCSELEKIKYAGSNPALFVSAGKLNFVADKWSLKIWKDTNTCKLCFPKLIRVSYRALHEGPSLLWVTDQDKNPAVFTYGAWINNRSLFPCQEPPSAMATWEAFVTVDNSSAVVLMSGDEEARIKSEDGRIYYYYYTKNVLPMSTLCLAIGFWQEHVIVPKYRFGPKCRIFAPKSLLDKAVLVCQNVSSLTKELFEYAPYCLKISEETFGTYPFPRIDFLIVPPTFGSLGMASPNVVFLSQSLLTGDSSMSSRVAHEIAHGWFGLMIGASDWSEEWLSEGFATFIEDDFHVRTMNMSKVEAKDYIEMKMYIRLRTLLQEISNTDEDLQILSGEMLLEIVDGVSASVLKNGQNRSKAFMQVHYIKGYFLLKHLSNIVRMERFFLFLKGYIDKYRGKLVTSKDFLEEYFTWFPRVRQKLTMEEIYSKWLHNPGVADELKHLKPSNENKMYQMTLQETKKWCLRNADYLQTKNKRNKFELEHYKMLSSEQQILLLESILEEPRVSQRTLNDLSEFFNFNSANAEVQHRWFELVVKYKYKPGYPNLKEFLANHLAMGVYLFGEMIYSNNSTLLTMAEERYLALKNNMEPNYVSTIQQMLQDVNNQ